MDLNKLCERVFALNDDIRYAGVIDSTGMLIAGGMRGGIDSIVNETEEELFLTHTALRKSMRERFDASMGRARFAYVEREKMSILTFYMVDKMLLVTLEPNVDSHTAIDIADDTLELLDGQAKTSIT
ncbi:MAG: hypothetical protein M3239_02455 [Thermoproteota archaeon]|jgi:hypothetical protein|nr:hypothetical protein [Thermoproteota archaeon]